jgi:hypothetical protein
VAHAQNSCQADCRDSKCAGLAGTKFQACVKQCTQSCPRDHRSDPPLLDPGCGNRTITGTIHCTINQPPVKAHETVIPSVLFAPGDLVDVFADGCVQTGGHGNTWKRYVNPSGPDSGRLYHGLVLIPTGTKDSALVRINTVIGKRLQVTGNGVSVDQLVLHLGYEDESTNAYGDNGYYSHDDGTEDQCKTKAGFDGGPAHVTITIFRAVKDPPPAQSRFDWDVVSAALDPNGLPLNPMWEWQTRAGNANKMPSTSTCHEFSRRGSTLGIPDAFMSPYFADCTDQADMSTVDLPVDINAKICDLGTIPYFGDTFPGHVNWFPVTMEGRGAWGDHGSDDDYTFTFHSDGIPGGSGTNAQTDPLSINGRAGLHVEFDSDETIDHFSSREWAQFHTAVDAWQTAKYLLSQCDVNRNCTDVQRALYQQTIAEVKVLFSGHTILTGMFGLDGEHGLKAELHPLYALAMRRDNFENSADDEGWLIFARNQGDEGFCSFNIWDAGFEDYTVKFPWRPGMTSVDVNWDKTEFVGTDGTSPPIVRAQASPPDQAGVYVTFHLGPVVHGTSLFEPGASVPFINGALHLVWTGTQAARAPSVAPAVTEEGAEAEREEEARAVAGPSAGGAIKVDDAEELLRAAIDKLPQEQRLQVQQARVLRGTQPVAVHPLAKGGPVEHITQKPAVVARREKLHAIKGPAAIHKTAREEAQMKALCAATQNAPSGLPPAVCSGASTQKGDQPPK